MPDLNIDNLIDPDGVWGELTFTDDYMAVTDGVQRCIEIMGEGWKDYAEWGEQDVATHVLDTLNQAIRLLTKYRDAFDAVVPPQVVLDRVHERLADTLKERALTANDLQLAVANMTAANRQRAKLQQPEERIHNLITAAFAPSTTKENA